MFQRTLWHWGYYKWLHIPKDVMVWVWALITCSKGHYGTGDIINDYIFQRMLWCECKHWLHIPNEVTACMFQRTLWHWGYYKWLHIPKDVMVWVWALITCSKGHYGTGYIINDYIFQRMLWCECKHWLHIPNEVTACMKIDYRFQRKLGHGCSHVYMFQRISWHIIIDTRFQCKLWHVVIENILQIKL